MKYLAHVTTLEFDHDKCAGCGKCVEVCPHGVFEIDKKEVKITDKDLCMECGACVNNCEFGALTVDYGVGCAAAIINSMITGGEPVCGCSGDDGDSGGGCC
jgi:ferredoxin